LSSFGQAVSEENFFLIDLQETRIKMTVEQHRLRPTEPLVLNMTGEQHRLRPTEPVVLNMTGEQHRLRPTEPLVLNMLSYLKLEAQ
jgi:hypothetical protein